MKKCISFLSLFFCLLFNVVYAAPALQPMHLTCEYLENPLGIDMAKPRLSWNFTSTKKNQLQTAYEIVVSDNEKVSKLLKGFAGKQVKLFQQKIFTLNTTASH